jgi:hypothetical protein
MYHKVYFFWERRTKRKGTQNLILFILFTLDRGEFGMDRRYKQKNQSILVIHSLSSSKSDSISTWLPLWRWLRNKAGHAEGFVDTSCDACKSWCSTYLPNRVFIWEYRECKCFQSTKLVGEALSSRAGIVYGTLRLSTYITLCSDHEYLGRNRVGFSIL